MRLSIWREFSSNHSARFTVIGRFQSVEQAHQAANELERMCRAITEWYLDHPDALEAWHEDAVPPSPPELELSQRYGLDWPPQSVDWFWSDDAAPRVVTQVDRLVFLTGSESWLGAPPIDHFMAQLGAQVLIDGARGPGEDSEQSTVTLDVRCTAPDEHTAERLVREVQLQIKRARSASEVIFATPWATYAGARQFELSSLMAGDARHDGSMLYLERLWLYHPGYGIPQLLEYLRAQGCTEIAYAFNETVPQYGDDDDWLNTPEGTEE